MSPAAVDRERIARDLDERGHARLARALPARECRALARLFDDDRHFRSTIEMARHRFGQGTYRYFAAPLPEVVAELRARFYVPLARIANEWEERLGGERRYPGTLDAFTRECRSAGQERPTPLLLRYHGGGFNCLHQDLYGDVAFPLQLAILLSRSPADAARDGRPADFEGGEFLLTEQRPRQQSRGEAIVLQRGEAVIFPNAARPVEGARGAYRAAVRHGVSRLHRGERLALGIIFHDAR